MTSPPSTPARKAGFVTSRQAASLAVGIALASVAMASHAAVTNGSFETGTLAGWTASGVTAVIGTGGGGPTNGAFQAYLDTSPSDASASPHVSTLSQTFTGGGYVSFSWNFFTNEVLGGAVADSAYVTVDGVTTTLADTASSFVPSSLGGYADMTGYRVTQINLAAFGTHTITFGVRDALDGNIDSALLIDQVSAVPEPAAISLLVLGLGALGLARRHKTRSGAAL